MKFGFEQHMERLVKNYPDLLCCVTAIRESFELLNTCYLQGGQVLVCGNGGSASDSEHIVGELMKGFLLPRPVPESFKSTVAQLFPEEANEICNRLQGALPAISLVSQSALISAYSNDISAELVFAQQVYVYGKETDVLLALSTSGNSMNVIRAIQVAKAKGMPAIGLAGKSGGMMKSLCDVTICVPYETTPAIQERHLPIYHTLCIMLEEAFFNK